jgi:hypothetical protein
MTIKPIQPHSFSTGIKPPSAATAPTTRLTICRNWQYRPWSTLTDDLQLMQWIVDHWFEIVTTALLARSSPLVAG